MDLLMEGQKFALPVPWRKLLSFFQTFQKQGIYILDEPEAALSPQRQLTLFMQIAQKAKEGSQFLIASHSPILLGLPRLKFYLLMEIRLKKFLMKIQRVML